MSKIFENFKSLDAQFSLYDIDEKDDDALVQSKDIIEILEELKRRKTQNGENWASNLLFIVEDTHGNSVFWVDVVHFECFF